MKVKLVNYKFIESILKENSENLLAVSFSNFELRKKKEHLMLQEI